MIGAKVKINVGVGGLLGEEEGEAVHIFAVGERAFAEEFKVEAAGVDPDGGCI